MDLEKVKSLQQSIAALRDELKAHAAQTTDAQCAALCSTSGEVMSGLDEAFVHFISKQETPQQNV